MTETELINERLVKAGYIIGTTDMAMMEQRIFTELRRKQHEQESI